MDLSNHRRQTEVYAREADKSARLIEQMFREVVNYLNDDPFTQLSREAGMLSLMALELERQKRYELYWIMGLRHLGEATAQDVMEAQKEYDYARKEAGLDL